MSYEDDHYEPPPGRRGYGSAPQPDGYQPSGGEVPAVFSNTAYQPPVFDENAADPWNPNGPAAPSGGALPAAAFSAEGTVNEDLDLDRLDPKGRASRAGFKRRTGNSGVSRKRKILKWTALGTAGLLAVVLGVGAYVVMHLDGNIKHTALLPTGVTQSAEIPDKFGNTAMNVLLIGTDARVSAADCKLGGDCSSSGDGNSDVMMVIHLSADRTNSTIMSIPRDTMTNIPDCGTNGSYYGMINSSLAYGASCTVATVHQLTGLTIDHYMEVDFSGVVTMSDALGGVPVCVSNNMYDKDSGLRLNAGTTVIEGKQALEFVRTRHGFYDGSDLGREKAQHIFLSNMIRTLRSKTSLTNLANLYTIADAATKSLTVDNGLDGISNLLSLFDTMNKVPTDRTTFVRDDALGARPHQHQPGDRGAGRGAADVHQHQERRLLLLVLEHRLELGQERDRQCHQHGDRGGQPVGHLAAGHRRLRVQRDHLRGDRADPERHRRLRPRLSTSLQALVSGGFQLLEPVHRQREFGLEDDGVLPLRPVRFRRGRRGRARHPVLAGPGVEQLLRGDRGRGQRLDQRHDVHRDVLLLEFHRHHHDYDRGDRSELGVLRAQRGDDDPDSAYRWPRALSWDNGGD